jgi:hypothetical protein
MLSAMNLAGAAGQVHGLDPLRFDGVMAAPDGPSHLGEIARKRFLSSCN